MEGRWVEDCIQQNEHDLLNGKKQQAANLVSVTATRTNKNDGTQKGVHQRKIAAQKFMIAVI